MHVCWFLTRIQRPSQLWSLSAGAKQPVHWFLESKGLGIQQGTSVWVGSPKSSLLSVDIVQSLLNTCHCDVYSFDPHPNHIPIKIQGPVKKTSHLRPIDLVHVLSPELWLTDCCSLSCWQWQIKLLSLLGKKMEKKRALQWMAVVLLVGFITTNNHGPHLHNHFGFLTPMYEGVNLLGVVYIMDHEFVPGPSKICDWLLNSSWVYFGLHQGKKRQSDHGVWDPQKIYFKAYIYH